MKKEVGGVKSWLDVKLVNWLWNFLLVFIILGHLTGLITLPGAAAGRSPGMAALSGPEGNEYFFTYASGDLVHWKDRSFLFRKKIMGNVRSVSVDGGAEGDQTAVLAVTGDSVLYGWGGGEGRAYLYLSDTHSKKPVRVMEEVSFAAVGRTCAAAVRTDRTLWVWGEGCPPKARMENVLVCRAFGDLFFVVDSSGRLYRFDGADELLYDGDAEPIAVGVRDVNVAVEPTYQCLMSDHSVRLLTAPLPLRQPAYEGGAWEYDNVERLCQGGFTRNFGELLVWQPSEEGGQALTLRPGGDQVESIASPELYLDASNHLYIEGKTFVCSLNFWSTLWRDAAFLWVAGKLVLVGLRLRAKRARQAEG